MSESLWSPSVLGVALGVFVAVLLLLEAAYLLWQQRYGQEARRVRARLQQLAEPTGSVQPQLWRRRASGPDAGQGRLSATWLTHRLERLLHQAGVSWRPGGALAYSLAAAFAVLSLGALLAPRLWVLTMASGLLVGTLPWMVVLWRRQRRLARLEQQLPEALDLMVRALRAGHAFSASLQMVADEMPEPMAGEFRTVHEEVNYGLDMHQAFANLVERVPLTDVRYFVVAVLIQREAGGNLAELLGNLSRLIRARLKLMARVRVLSSEGRLSGWILVILPFALGGLLYAFNPQFMQPLWTDPIGVTLLQVMGGAMVIGVFLMRKIVRIRV